MSSDAAAYPPGVRRPEAARSAYGFGGLAAWPRLGQHAVRLAQAGVDADILHELSDEHLKELGLPLGHRLRLRKAVQALERPTSVDVPEPVEGERRQVAILFADLVDYTGLCNSLDAEDIHALLSRFFACVDGIIDAHGGTPLGQESPTTSCHARCSMNRCVPLAFASLQSALTRALVAQRQGEAVTDSLLELRRRAEALDLHIVTARTDRATG